mgnify:CR=1 FL=1
MIIHQIKFSLINAADKPDEEKAYECEQFQSALMNNIEKQKLPITSARLDDVEITGGYDSTVKSVAVSFDADTQTGKLVVEFSDGTAGVVGFDDLDVVVTYINGETLFVEIAPAMPFV